MAEVGVHWTYSGKHGPEHWGELSEALVACSEDKSQSPIDIVDPIALAYRGSTTAIVNNGHTLGENARGPQPLNDRQVVR